MDVAGTDTEDGDDTGTAAEDAVGAGVIEMVGAEVLALCSRKRIDGNAGVENGAAEGRSIRCI